MCANVGVQQFGAIDRLTEDDWRWVLEVNVLGTVRTVAAFLPMIRQRSGLRRILLTASSGALVPGVRLAAYTASKDAVIGYVEAARTLPNVVARLDGQVVGVCLVRHHNPRSAEIELLKKKMAHHEAPVILATHWAGWICLPA